MHNIVIVAFAPAKVNTGDKMKEIKIYKPTKMKNRDLWQVRIAANGKICAVYGETKAAAQIKALEKQEELRKHIICDGTTVEEFAAIWIEQRCANLSPTSLQEWKRLLNKHIVPVLGRIRLTDLRCADCQSLITEYNKTHSAKSCKALRGVLHTMLEYAKMNELISSNPCEHILITKTPAYQYYIYSVDEMRRLLDIVKGNKDHELPVVLASKCGLRAGEIFGLRWEDIDLENRTLQVHQVSIYANGKKMLKNVPKTATSTKPITIPLSVVEVLKRYKSEAKYPLVVCNADGTPIVSSNYHQRFDTLLRLNGLPKTRFHDLRHFVATSLMDAGIPDKMIAEYLRHADTNITKHYQHIRESTKAVASDTMDSILA